MVEGMTLPKSRIRALIRTVALLRCLARETRWLLIALAGLLAAAAAMIHHWL